MQIGTDESVEGDVSYFGVNLSCTIGSQCNC